MASLILPTYLRYGLAHGNASSGFAVPARRGHYDLLLTSGVSRLRIGAAHCAASMVPGVFYWLSIAAIEAIARGGFPGVSLATGTIAALLIVSALAWAATVPFPRLTGGIVWLLIFVAPVDHDLLPTTVRALVLPWTLVGTSVLVSGPLPLVAAAVVVVTAVVSALAWICRTDISLQVAR